MSKFKAECSKCGVVLDESDLKSLIHCDYVMTRLTKPSAPSDYMSNLNSIWSQGVFEYGIEPGKVYHFSGPGAFQKWEREMKRHGKVVSDIKLTPIHDSYLRRRKVWERIESERRRVMKGDWKQTQVEVH